MQNCRKCGRELPRDALQELSGISHCPVCEVVFAYSREGSNGGSVDMPRVPLPRAITVYDSDGPADDLAKVGGYRERWQPVLVPNEFRIVRRWFTWWSVHSLALALFMNAFLVLWYAAPRGHTRSHTQFVLFPLPFVPVALWLTFSALSGLFNSTIIRAHDGVLEVTHGPISVRRSRTTLPLASVEWIYCERKVTDSKGYGGPTISYNLCVRTKIGLEKVLIADLPEANQALYLQQAIESRLGLISERVLEPTKREAGG